MTENSFQQPEDPAFSKRAIVQKDRAAAQWLEENRPALAAYNAWVETNGLPLQEHRQF